MDDSLVREGAFREQFEAIVEGIFTKHWWERIWICQEIAVARSVTVVCGSKSIPWIRLMIFYYFMDDFKRAEFGHVIGRIGRDNAPMTNMASALNWLRHAYQAQKSMPLQELVLEFRNFRANALLGIATDGEKFPNPDC
jgi:hypothetical protein